MENAHHAGARAVHRGTDERLHRHGEPRRPTVYSASRRAAGIPSRARRNDDRLRRLFRQPAIHQSGQSRRQSEGASVPDRLHTATARQDLGRSACRRGGRRAHGDARDRRVRGARRTGDRLHRLGLGRELSAAYPAAFRGRGRRGRARGTRSAHRSAGSRAATASSGNDELERERDWRRRAIWCTL